VVERTWVSYPIVVVASGCTLILALVTGRILAPFVGVSIHTWVACGTLAGALSCGEAASHAPSA
jgi:hypothetical protein